MDRRRGLLFALLIVAAAAAFWDYSYRESSGGAVKAAAPRPAAATAQPRPAALSPEEALVKSRSRYRLGIDRRLAEAFGVVAAFPGNVRAPVTARYADGAWLVSVNGKAVGSLPTYPDFDDVLTLLRKQAAATLTGLKVEGGSMTPEEDGRASSFDQGGLLALLAELNPRAHPGTASAPDLRAAAEAYARLGFFEKDETEAADGLYAKGLGLLALAEAANGAPLTKEEGLLAQSMGYSAAAARRVTQLPASDPWREYVQLDDDDLERTARLNPDSTEASYLWLRRLADLDRKQDWLAWFKLRYGQQPLKVSTTSTILAMEGHTGQLWGINSIELALLMEMGAPVPTINGVPNLLPSPAPVIGGYQKGLDAKLQGTGGPYLSPEDVSAYYNGFLYTALQSYCVYLLDEWGRPKDAMQFRELLSRAPGDPAHDLYVWYGDKIASEEGGRSLADMVNDMGSSKVLGPGIYNEALDAMTKRLPPGVPQTREAVEQVGLAFDTRPELREDFADLAALTLDLADREDLYASLAAQQAGDDSVIRMYVYAHDDNMASLKRAANDPHLGVWVRTQAAGYLATGKDGAPAARSAYEAILAQYPTYGSSYREYLGFLRKQKDYAAMEKTAKTWLLNQPSDKSIFDFWDATDALAEAQLHLGDADQAWMTVLPALFDDGQAPAPGTPTTKLDFSDYGQAMGEGVDIALARGDTGMALTIAQQEAETYPDSFDSQADLLQVWWHTGEYAKAAALLGGWKQPTAPWQWRVILGKPFAEELGADPQRAAQAFAPLVAARIDTSNLYALVDGLADAGHPQAAFGLEQELTGGGMRGVEADLSAYQELKKYENVQEAESWLSGKLPPELRDEQSVYYYYMHLNELLWDMIPDPTQFRYPDQIWLLRAAAAAQGMPLSEVQQAAFDRYLNSGNPAWYPTLARYVMGRDDGHGFLNKPMDPHTLSEAAYYLALRDLSQGNYREALDWLNVEMDTGQVRNGEWHMGEELLSSWGSSGKALKVLASEGKLYNSGS